jgi:hypothetical protein
MLPHVPPLDDTAEATDFPIGWVLKKNSWHFHRRFYAVFRRPMERGEYSHLLGQVRRGTAEHLGENCWRVTLPGGSRTLPVLATPWRLITILPKNWQPPTSVPPSSSGSSSSERTPAPGTEPIVPAYLPPATRSRRLIKSDLIAELAASPHLRIADAELIVAMVFGLTQPLRDGRGRWRRWTGGSLASASHLHDHCVWRP